jgi:hypothetical protein
VAGDNIPHSLEHIMCKKKTMEVALSHGKKLSGLFTLMTSLKLDTFEPPLRRQNGWPITSYL